MKIKLLLVLTLCSFIAFAQKATVFGKVLDAESKTPLHGVTVSIKSEKKSTLTDTNGSYSIPSNANKCTVSFSYVGYETRTETIIFSSNEKQEKNIYLKSSSKSLDEVVIQKTASSREKETALLTEQKKAVEIKQSIGAQELSRKGVSDVEEGLTKITGITKVDGRGLFVRGLEDRYNNLLINDLAVPSNNPFKKIIALDLFPTDIVSVLETYKTFNSNLYGDFAGGTFNIVTTASNKPTTKLSIGTGFTTQNNLQKFIISSDASSTSDFFGFSGNDRDLPKIVGTKPSNYQFTSQESIKSFGSGFDAKETKSPLNSSISILHSDKYSFGTKKSIQYLFSVNYDNSYQVRKGLDRFFNTNQGNYDNNLVATKYKFTTNASLLGSIVYKSNRAQLVSNTFYLKTTENLIQDQLGYTNSQTNQNNTFIRLNQLQETSFLNSQLLFNYKLTSNEKHQVKAGISYAKTNFSLPDRKSFRGTLDNNTINLNYTGNSIVRQYMDFDGKYNVSGLLEYNWKFGSDDLTKAHKLTVGYNGYLNQMESSFRFMVSQNMLSNSVSFPVNAPDATLQSELYNLNFTYREGTNASYKAKLQEFVNAGYVDLALKLGSKTDVNFGSRLEQSSRETRYREPGDFDAPFIVKKVDKFYVLPTVNSKYKLNDKSNLRFAASKTITRPVVMESYPLEFVNPDATIENGNPNVKNSENYNFDLKYELFPTNKEMVAVSLFSKYLQNPIERLFVQSAGSGGLQITYNNSKSAVLYGAELEFLLQMKRISESLSNFSVGFNTSLMLTQATIDKENNAVETIVRKNKTTRNLQGASPWLINADLKYEADFNKNWKNTMTLVYNIYGKRIYAVGTNGLDHYYEMPFGKLDFIWSNKFSEKWELKLGVDNILNPLYKIEMGKENDITIYENDLTIKDYKRGTGFSLNLSYTF
ncbi:outer membrane receptor protein involved in Fe transport [Flavobacterium croceum DSM 17960]|uniref:Outer membrane receptor protein involved in Fe transport n=1 Tax=Flavobacterium croceum DSM 17960 TaxID=1121886 RepID=A0A2S4N689_9FLAO|nr:TonB-dependent receptor [Flavobacterium croceum]POS01217.1 outer membrane receptor protein involved in Fe transport [Flavobacterium croceum DSM 17960]